MLFADVAPSDIGTFALIAAGVLVAAYHAKSLWDKFFPPAPAREGDSAWVTHGELKELLQELRDAQNHGLIELKAIVQGMVPRAEYDVRHHDVTRRVEELGRYMHEREHKLADGMQTLTNKMDVLTATIQREIGRREGSERGGKHD